MFAVAAPHAAPAGCHHRHRAEVDASSSAGTFADEALAAYVATLGRLRLIEREDTELEAWKLRYRDERGVDLPAGDDAR